MKKRKLLGLIAIFLFWNCQNVSAADTQIDEQNSTAQMFINVRTSATTPLYLENAPTFDFAQIKYSIFSEVIKGNAKGNLPFSIVDLSGTGKGYELQQQVTDLTLTDSGGNALALSLEYFNISVQDNADTSIIGTNSVNIYGQSATVLLGQGQASGRKHSGEVSAEFAIKGKNLQKIGEYQATITNTLVAGF